MPLTKQKEIIIAAWSEIEQGRQVFTTEAVKALRVGNKELKNQI